MVNKFHERMIVKIWGNELEVLKKFVIDESNFYLFCFNINNKLPVLLQFKDEIVVYDLNMYDYVDDKDFTIVRENNLSQGIDQAI